jgi:Xaa-Pro dipeptidase
MPHYSGGPVSIEKNSPLLADFGGGVGGYLSDITRVYLPREADDELKRAYEVVVQANEAAFGKAGPGVTCEEVDRAARSVIENAGLDEYFIHRTGHGLGLEEHEAPYIRAGDKTELRPGHVFTIEPGVYVSGRFGLRYENVVAVTERGVESLNESPAYHWLP